MKIDGWFGFQALGVVAPAFIAQLLHAPDLSQKIQLGTGLAMGAVYSLVTTQRKLRRLRAENHVSVLAELDENNVGAPDLSSRRGPGGFNFMLTNRMEEFIND
jgi:hypothetical protein